MQFTCDRCGKVIKGQRYIVKIHIFADFDGTIDVDENIDIDEIIRKTVGIPSSILEEEIHKEFTFSLCQRCKEIFSANPLNKILENMDVPDKIPPTE